MEQRGGSMADLDAEWEPEWLAESLTFPRPLLNAFCGRGEPKATTDFNLDSSPSFFYPTSPTPTEAITHTHARRLWLFVINANYGTRAF